MSRPEHQATAPMQIQGILTRPIPLQRMRTTGNQIGHMFGRSHFTKPALNFFPILLPQSSPTLPLILTKELYALVQIVHPHTNPPIPKSLHPFGAYFRVPAQAPRACLRNTFP